MRDPAKSVGAAELRESPARLAFLLQLNDALRPLSDPSEVQATAARLVGEHLRVNRAGYAEIHDREYVIRREYVSGVAPLVGHGPVGTFGAALRELYRRGEPVIVTNVATDPRFTDPERTTMHARQIAAFVGVTLLKGGRIVAAFGVNHASPREWTAMEVELIRDVAERTWDAVERTRAEATLREREQRLRLALEASAGGSWTWMVSSNQLDWDYGFRERYGFSADEPASFDGWLSRVCEEDRPQVLRLLDDILRIDGVDTWDNTFRVLRPDGTQVWMQSRGRAERDPDGSVRLLTGLELDITQHRRSEEEFQARRDEERERELRLLLETAKQGIVSVDASGTIVTANRAMEKMFGWAPGELIGQALDRLVPTALRETHARHRAEYFKAPYPRLMGSDRDLIGERKDGTTFPIEVSLNHVATPGGEHAYAFVTDITERRRADAALQERTAQLEQRTAQLSQLASDLTLAEHHAREQLSKTLHDGLQQLLVVAAMNLDQQAKRDAHRGVASPELLVLAKTHLNEAINAARSLSFELSPPVLEGSGLPGALRWLADWARNKYGLEVVVSADPKANSDRKDVRTLLFESVRELLFNAVKHAQVDRATVELTRDRDGLLCITVSDRGVGFDAAKLLDRVTGRFGWGLFSIRERLTLLGGRFEVDSKPGDGARFRLIAPGAVADDVPSVADHTQPVLSKRGPRRTVTGPNALRIMIVDDHSAVRRILRELLSERPEFRTVGFASNGVEAITQARALRPDVILMDVAMPEMDGVEATRRIRAELPFIQILGLSMQPRTQELHAIEKAGASAFFTKGVDTQRLLDELLEIHAAIIGAMPDGPV